MNSLTYYSKRKICCSPTDYSHLTDLELRSQPDRVYMRFEFKPSEKTHLLSQWVCVCVRWISVFAFAIGLCKCMRYQCTQSQSQCTWCWYRSFVTFKCLITCCSRWSDEWVQYRLLFLFAYVHNMQRLVRSTSNNKVNRKADYLFTLRSSKWNGCASVFCIRLQTQCNSNSYLSGWQCVCESGMRFTLLLYVCQITRVHIPENNNNLVYNMQLKLSISLSMSRAKALPSTYALLLCFVCIRCKLTNNGWLTTLANSTISISTCIKSSAFVNSAAAYQFGSSSVYK